MMRVTAVKLFILVMSGHELPIFPRPARGLRVLHAERFMAAQKVEFFLPFKHLHVRSRVTRVESPEVPRPLC